MTDLIPRLPGTDAEAAAGELRDVVTAEFAARFLGLHEQDRAIAQRHWEQIVERVLNTDAVDSRATGRRAMRQAVRATVVLLERSDLRERCPLCVRRPAPPRQAVGGGNDA